jgi:hypothetical protein
MERANPNAEPRDEILDLEVHSATGAPAPACHGYRIRVNGEPIVFQSVVVTGEDVLEAAGLCPPEAYCLLLRVRGQAPRFVEADTQIDLSAPGVERFVALKRGPVRIKLNEHELTVDGPKTTGLAIKEAGAKANLIEVDFVLSLELSGRRTKIIGDNDVLILEGGECFVAVAPDDNS